ncbi:MAG: DUF433 domain-containing protein [Chitinophagales bacterium]|jgi:uncharacterized protein (DUF433 family)|nr:DUF433 domain-containing protein [Chitinophagales bacterium]
MENWKERISINPEIRFGKPCIKGTRISIEDILRMLSSDMSLEEIIEDFPQLTREDILAAISFANKREEVTRYIIS